MKLSISMTRREKMLGAGFLLVSMFALPFAFGIVSALLPRPLTDTEVNILYFSLNFLCVTVIFRRFLENSVKAVIAAPRRCFGWALLGLAVYYPVSMLLARGIRAIAPDFSNVNDGAIAQMTQTYTGLMVFATGVLVPVYEEVLYRGLIFQGLHSKSRALAYCVSVAVFAFIHIMGYVGLYDGLTLLLCFMQYLPAGAILAYTYERADTVITPILIHIIINQISLLAMR